MTATSEIVEAICAEIERWDHGYDSAIDTSPDSYHRARLAAVLAGRES